ncbi:TIGR00282 family metallophosphoesterase [Alicyclobacillus ferrooxydans]|uniref:Metallophosphoesterase n=1 Tax=Alicyclobacillus ferrooxydans TaxID=471514 RepID=A0A0P9CT66_9BACL|nr:TIGR00282 family metallophosphoesterase [Alicyclobacillus ferrooxydans]KPV39856.1 metallophosphoesterase [Alicyclobacillus ferrooxydans]
MNVLFIGDIVGLEGQEYAERVLEEVSRDHQLDLVIANGENAVHGRGLNRKAAERLYDAGVEIITLGNHTWDQHELQDFIDEDARIVRPCNYPPGTPGRGYTVCKVGSTEVLVVNLMGRTFLSQLDCPFRTIDAVLKQHPAIRHIIVDMHAEVTSEKLAMGWYLDGRVSAVFGTHTHVPTADERVLPHGTAYITDVGMVGPRDGILGVDREIVIGRLISQMPARFSVAKGPRQFHAVLCELSDETGRATAIKRVTKYESA